MRDNQAFRAGPRPVARAGAPWIIFYFRRDVPLIREPADAYQYGTSGGLPAGAATTRKQEGTSVKFLTRVVREHSIDRSAKGGGHGDHCRTVRVAARHNITAHTVEPNAALPEPGGAWRPCSRERTVAAAAAGNAMKTAS